MLRGDKDLRPGTARGNVSMARRGLFSRIFGERSSNDDDPLNLVQARVPQKPPPSALPLFSFEDAQSESPEEHLQLLGGKGHALAEMRQALDLHVPPGFILGTPLCRTFLKTGWPAGLDAALEARIRELEEATGKRLGDAENPLLVSVRSGAPVSMPGMMDTVLNLGANETTVSALARQSGDERFALDTRSRFCRMYAAIVLGISEDDLGPAPGPDAGADDLKADVSAVRDLCAARTTWIPEDPMAQLRAAIEAVFRSSQSDRARVYRDREGIDQDMPTAVVVQAMVFGNTAAASGTGVAFTRNPSTGANEPYGDFLLNAQGEDVVAGKVASQPLGKMQEALPGAHAELLSIMDRLDRHYNDMCDIEFTVENGELFILQTRIGKRSAIAAARIAVELADDPGSVVTRGDAVRRISAGQLKQLQSMARVQPDAAAIASGVAASPGVVSGIICTDPDRVAKLAEGGRNVILLRPITSPEDVHGMVAAAGILTSTGGMVSHAALVARGWGIAAVCGVESLRFDPVLTIGGIAFDENDKITIDGNSGKVFAGDCVDPGHEEPDELRTLRQWSTDLGLELGNPETGKTTTNGELSDRSVDSFELVRAVALLGFGGPDRVAEVLMTTPTAVESAIKALPEGTINKSPRGLHLSPEGKEWLIARMLEERERVDQAAADTLYRQFMELDARFKQLVTDWQIRTIDGQQVPNDHSDAAHDDAVRQRLSAFHLENLGVLDQAVGLAPRLSIFKDRFGRAITAIVAGDGTMIASPLKDSYHTAWFELHEELIHLSGRDRATEEARHNQDPH